MLLAGIFKNVTEGEKKTAIEKIIQHATPRNDFFLMMMLSVGMAVLGVALDNTVVLIGSMLIAPLLYPILSLSLGIIMADQQLIGRSVYTLIKSVGYALAVGIVIGVFFIGDAIDSNAVVNLIGSVQPSFVYALVAAIAGFAAAFAITKEHLSETLPGVAISVALVPPLAVAGFAVAHLNWVIVGNALLLFLANVIGIIFSALIVFSLLRLGVKQKVATEVVKEEEKIIKKEEAMANGEKTA